VESVYQKSFDANIFLCYGQTHPGERDQHSDNFMFSLIWRRLSCTELHRKSLMVVWKIRNSIPQNADLGRNRRNADLFLQGETAFLENYNYRTFNCTNAQKQVKQTIKTIKLQKINIFHNVVYADFDLNSDHWPSYMGTTRKLPYTQIFSRIKYLGPQSIFSRGIIFATGSQNKPMKT
jgi:hypothetical protein